MPNVGDFVHRRFAAAVGQMYGAKPLVDYVLEDPDGQGPRLVAWNFAQPIPTDAQIATALVQVAWLALRARRDAVLAASQWLVDRHRDQAALNMTTSLTTLQFAALLTWRQQLRDFPANNAGSDPTALVLPDPPAATATAESAGT